VSTPTETPAAPDAPATGWSRGAKVQVVVLVVNVIFWAAILGWTLASGDEAYDPPDRLADRAFPVGAEPVCAATVAAIEDLGLPTEVATPLERAEMVDEENRLLRTMVDDLAALDRPEGEEGEWVSSWLADWRVHIDDRQAWADDLRAGDDHLFVETARAGDQVSNIVDNFAEVNDMESCVTTGDV
jgi:hypothetical protein